MSVNISGVAVPAGATVSVRIEPTAPANVTAYMARHQVTRFVVSEISTQLRG